MRTLESSKQALRRIADEMIASRNPVNKKPLRRVQECLEEIEHCVEKLTRILLRVKDLAIVLEDLALAVKKVALEAALLTFFVWEVIKLCIRLGL